MITPNDREFKSTKLIKQGKKVMKQDFKELADWIYETYNIKPLNIIYDKFKGYKSILTPRLQIVFEFGVESKLFRDEIGNFDHEKQQAITAAFKHILLKKGLIKEKTLIDYFRKTEEPKYQTDNLLVVFSAFEPIAREDANGAVSKDEIEKLKEEINSPDLWEISVGFQSATFFFFTDNQVETYSLNGLKQVITDKYFAILKKYDEFDYFKREQFLIALDSKENFDKNYESNWYYYYK